MKQKLKKLPRFKNENAERNFWQKHSPLDYFEVSRAKIGVFPNLKPSNKPISIRLPESFVIRLKMKANAMDIPYHTIIKQAIARELDMYK